MQPAPRYSKGQILTVNRFLPPVFSGSSVSVLDVRRAGKEYRYQVRPTDYASQPVWAYEEDLSLPLSDSFDSYPRSV